MMKLDRLHQSLDRIQSHPNLGALFADGRQPDGQAAWLTTDASSTSDAIAS